MHNPMIDIDGFKHGTRVKKLGQSAYTYYLALLPASNSLARFKADYQSAYEMILGSFPEPLSELQYLALIKEYVKADLLFLYKDETGQAWGQWDAKKECLPRYAYAEHQRTPAPPEPAYSDWLARLHPSSNPFGNLPTSSHTSETLRKSSLDEKKKRSRKEEEEESTASCHEDKRNTPPQGWDDLVIAAASVEMVMDPAPDSDLCRQVWVPMGLSEKHAAIEGVRKRRECGEYSDPGYVPSLDNYLRKKKWRASLRIREPKPPGKVMQMRNDPLAGLKAGFGQ